MKYLEIKKIIAERAARALPSQRLPGFHDMMAEFGVSQSTISKALDLLEAEGVILRKQGGGIMPASSKRSITIAKRKRLPETKSHTILFSYPAYYSGGLWYMLNTVKQTSHARRCDVLFLDRTIDMSTEKFVENVRRIKHVTGIIYQQTTEKLSAHELELLGSLDCKVVLYLPPFNYPELPKNVFSVMPDEIAAGEMLAEHLLSLGHLRPGFVIHSPKQDTTELYFKSFRRYFQKHGFPIPDSRIFRAGTQPWENALDAAAKTVSEHLADIREEKITSLVFSSSDGAIAAIRTLRKSGFRVPEDIGIAGHGDMPLYQHMPDVPALVCFDFAETTNRALDFILSRKKTAEQEIYIKPQLKPYNGICSL